jgi:hydroxyacylglutathione hydrolase
MALIFERIHTEGIAQLSYLVGDSSTGMSVVIDPRPDCDVYLELARKYGVGITHIFETHIHADFMSGSRELSHRLNSVPIYVSHAGGAEYGFETEELRDGQGFELGEVVVTARHTPGHTPEHVSFLIAEASRKDPFGIFSGDAVFVDSVGRPDLLGEDETQGLASQLYATLRDVYLKLEHGVILYPGHGAGSACGPDIGDRKESTLGYERKFNPYLGLHDEKKFIEKVLSTAPPEPRHYRPMKKVNAAGPKVFGGLPPVPALPAKEFRKAVESGRYELLDTRDMLSFGGGHIRGALNIADRAELSVWAGQMLELEAPILLVLESDDRLERVVKLLWRTGHTNFAGYLAGGMKAWETAGFPFEELPQMSVHELKKDGANVQVLDVRTPSEWKEGHLPGAQHLFAPEIRERSKQLDRGRPVVTYCDSGFRANIAASILRQEGFERVCNVPGSMQAWKRAGYPLEKPKDR